MKHYYTKSYLSFKCIADKCPDSCCKDWDVVVDDESYEYYSNVKGSFGDKLRSITTIDSDGDRIFVPQNGRCPFWNESCLCDIYTELGEEHLCDTCRDFPRLEQDFTSFSEHMLSLACPEACRMIMADSSSLEYTEKSDEVNITPDYDTELMTFLLEAREETLKLLTDKNSPFSQRIEDALAYNREIQSQLDGVEYVPSQKLCPELISDIHKRLDIMDKSWFNTMCLALDKADLSPIHTDYDEDFTRLSVYYIQRYYLTAIDSLDVISSVNRLYSAYIVIGKLYDFHYAQQGILSFEDRVKIMQRYSKEVEHSYENAEMLCEEMF